jgi:hypothetical protein
MRNMKNLVQALAMAGIAMAASTAHATLLTQNFTFSGTSSVTDTDSSTAATSSSDVAFATKSIAQFDSSMGVLTGVTVNLSGTQTQTTTVSAAAVTSSSNSGNMTSSGSGSSTVQLSAPTVTYTSDTWTATATCKAKATEGCSGTSGPVSRTTNASLAVTTDNLNSYVGTGNTSISLSAPTLSALQTDVFPGTETTKTTVSWSGSGSVVYNYLLHADASFLGTKDQNILSLDFGNVTAGATDPLISFSIFNLADANRTGLDLLKFKGTGDFDVLSTDFSATTNVLQGASKTFSAMLDTSTVGNFNAVYTFYLSDTNFGASDSLSASTLTLNLKGSVVPEPLSAALLGIGMLGIAAVRRRK